MCEGQHDRKEVGDVARDKNMHDIKALEWTLDFIKSLMGNHKHVEIIGAMRSDLCLKESFRLPCGEMDYSTARVEEKQEVIEIHQVERC